MKSYPNVFCWNIFRQISTFIREERPLLHFSKFLDRNV